MNEYIILNKTAIEKRIEELKKELKQFEKYQSISREPILTQIEVLKQLLSQSTPLIPEIEKAIEFGKDIRREKSFINNNYGSAFVDYEDSTEETNNYISNLKLI